MALNLVKGQIEPIASTISKLRVGLGWEPNESLSSHDFDLDVTGFLVAPNNKVLNENYLVFYNSELRVHPDRLNKLEPQNPSIYLPYIDKNGKSNAGL